MCFGRCFYVKNIRKNNIDGNNHFLQRRQVSKKIRRTTFEALPNELIFMLFDYLYFHEIIYAFNKFSSRIQFLLHSYNSYHLNFNHLLTKRQFNVIQSLPLNCQHVKSLILSNNYFSFTNVQECLLQYRIELFYPRLQSLSLVDCDNYQLLSIILLTSNFQQLKYLSIISENYTSLFSDIIEPIRNQILFEIKTLKHFKWNSKKLFFTGIHKTMLNRRSSIEHYEFSWIYTYAIEWLYSHSLNMKSIHIHVTKFDTPFNKEINLKTVIRLKIDKFDSEQKSPLFLEKLSVFSQLKFLELKCDRFYRYDAAILIDGYTWENFIRNNLPQLETFKFFFATYVFHINLKEFIKTFMTDFWLIEKKWYVTWHWDSITNFLYVYTVPYSNDQFIYDGKLVHQESTAKVNDMLNVRCLILRNISKLTISNDRFPNIQTLEIDSISTDVDYNQLNLILKLSSIQTIIINNEIDSELFFDILKKHQRKISIDIAYIDLMNMLRKRESEKKDIISLCNVFPNMKRLIMNYSDSWQVIPILLWNLKKLSFLSMSTSDEMPLFQEMHESTILELLIEQSGGKLKKNNFYYEMSKYTFRLIID
ncbi:unnamed protein product [Rotaria magnacalcarata]|uniref:F-box domain-containing protein n=1 Tax=Rotaria magnacalcarata TaxID=392030 RepID=A0A8S2RDY1_9BILA|nr:unnamed protein product [Rotaria magnacalcarata]